MTAFAPGGGVYHAIVGTLLQGLVCAIISIPIGVFVGDLPGRVRRRHPARQGHHVHGRHPHRCPVDRGGAVHLRAVGGDARIPTLGLRGVAGPGAADDPGHRAVHRGDAADRPDGSAGSDLRTGRAEVEDDRAHRHPDRAVGHRHRHHAGAGPRHGRDGAAADPGRLRRSRSTSTCSAGSWARCPA